MQPVCTGTRYVLAVKNLAVSADFYRHQLGFHSLWEGGGWHFLARDHVKLMLGECPDDLPAFETGCHSYFAYIETEDIDGLYHEFQEKQVTIVSAIEDKPWGQREFGVQTVDGHRITFGQSIADADL